MKIAITIDVRQGQEIWSTDVDQNIFHLACLFDALPMVEKVFLLHCGDPISSSTDLWPVLDRFPLLSMAEMEESVDIVVEMGGVIDAAWSQQIRSRGVSIVSMVCAQPYSGLVEPTIFNRPSSFRPPDCCDEIWLLPKDANFAPIMRTIYRCPVKIMPYLWSPAFIDHAAATLDMGNNIFGYSQGALQREAAKIAIFEPNIATIQCGIIPLMIAEEAHRRQNSLIDHLHLINGIDMVDHLSFNYLASGLDIHKDSKLTIHSREYFVPFMAGNANVIISHQLDCEQDYLYIDALYGGYPLIHNSETFKHLGYYYPRSDIAAGADALMRAIADHDASLPDYRKAAGEEVARLSPQSSANKDAYCRELLALKNLKKAAI